MPPPKYIQYKAQPQPGEMAHIELELKLIADIGLVGFPNAGKSSVLRALSAATPAVAPYPFTTLHPLVGCVEYQDGIRVQVADIPGLIGGASQGRGQGHEFLRHIERTKALLYMVDVAGVDFRDPLRDLEVLVEELESYQPGNPAVNDRGSAGTNTLLDRPALVAGNKVDLLHPDKELELEFALQEKANELGLRMAQDVLMISAGVSGAGLGKLAEALRAVTVYDEASEMSSPPRDSVLNTVGLGDQ